MDRMLQIEGLTKRFGTLTAVDHISFGVGRGEVLGFLGPNGAGKTTAMRMVAGFLAPTEGTALVAGYDVTRDPIEVKKRIGYLPEGAPLYEEMTPLELLDFVCDARAISGARRREAIATTATRINIEGVMHQSIGTLSKGFKRRVGIAQAIIHDPEILILDEPTDGLDPNQKHEVRKLINEMAREKAIVISTHLLEEVEVVCTRAIIIANGRIVADGTPAELAARSELHNAVTVRIAADQKAACLSLIDGLGCVGRTASGPDGAGAAELIAYPADGQIIIDDIAAAIHGSGIQVRELRAERGRLDDVFRRLTTAG